VNRQLLFFPYTAISPSLILNTYATLLRFLLSLPSLLLPLPPQYPGNITEPVLLAKTRVESEWSHESPGFSCVAVDASVETLPRKSPSKDSKELSTESVSTSDFKYTHAALYSLRTIKHSTPRNSILKTMQPETILSDSPKSQGTGVGVGTSVGVGTGTGVGGLRGRISSALLGDYSTLTMQTLIDKGENSPSGGTIKFAGNTFDLI
jgi:hypothetical protein